MSRYTPSIFCLQETHLSPPRSIHFRGFTPYRVDVDDGLRAHGGVTTLVQDSLHSAEIPVHTDLQTVCVRVYLPSLSLTVCNIYIPPRQTVSVDDLLSLINQLPTPFLVVGDVNAHSPLWGSSRTCQRGAILESVIDTMNLAILNTGEPTHFAVATNSSTAIDVALCSSSLATAMRWTILEDLYEATITPRLSTLIIFAVVVHGPLNGSCDELTGRHSKIMLTCQTVPSEMWMK